jgi:hypothetical protein
MFAVQLKRRLAAGMPLEAAAQLMPVFVGGPIHRARPMGIMPITHEDVWPASASPTTSDKDLELAGGVKSDGFGAEAAMKRHLARSFAPIRTKARING